MKFLKTLKKPTAIEMAQEAFKFLTDEEWEAMNYGTGFSSEDMREVIMKFAPEKKCKYSLERSLKIASRELECIKSLPWESARFRVLYLFLRVLFKNKWWCEFKYKFKPIPEEWKNY